MGSMLDLYRNELRLAKQRGAITSKPTLNFRREQSGMVVAGCLTEKKCRNAAEFCALLEPGNVQRPIIAIAMHREACVPIWCSFRICERNWDTMAQLEGSSIVNGASNLRHADGSD